MVFPVKLTVTLLYPTLSKPMGYRAHGILQTRILEWVAFPFSRGSSWPKDWTQVSHIAGKPDVSNIRGKPKNTGVGSLSLPDPGIKSGSPVLQVDALTTELWGKPKGRNRLLKSYYSGLCSKWLPVSFCLWSLWRYRHWMGWAGGDFFSHLLMVGMGARKWISRAESVSGHKGCA